MALGQHIARPWKGQGSVLVRAPCRIAHGRLMSVIITPILDGAEVS